MAASPHVPLLRPREPGLPRPRGRQAGGTRDASRCATATTSPCSTRPGVADVSLRHRRRPLARRPATRPGATRSPSSPTARPSSGSATSARSAPCRSWRARRCCSSTSPASTPCPVVMEIGHGRRARRGDRADRAVLRRHQPRGHLRAALLRDRGAAQGAARHPGLPRRPARHRDRRARRPAQRRARPRPPPGGAAGRRLRRRRRRRRRDAAAASGRACATSSSATRAASSTRRADLTGHKAPARGHDQPARPHGRARRGARGRRRLRRGLRRPGARGGGGRRWRREAIIFALANPDARGAPRRRPPARRGRRHRALGLPEPDQQRAGLPRHLPRGARLRAPPRSPRR